MKKHLKQVSARPYVLVLLLGYLIGQNHPVFHGTGSAADPRARMRKEIEAEYPETEPDKRPEDREGAMPKSVLSLLEDPEREEGAEDAEKRPQERPRICNDKNATPGDGARSLDKRLEFGRMPSVSTGAPSPPATPPR